MTQPKSSGVESSNSTAASEPFPLDKVLSSLKISRLQLDMIVRSVFSGDDSILKNNVVERYQALAAAACILICGSNIPRESTLYLLRDMASELAAFPEHTDEVFAIQILDGRYAVWPKSGRPMDLLSGERIDALPRAVMVSVAFSMNALYDQVLTTLSA